jgi:protein-tyrosine phosphatase
MRDFKSIIVRIFLAIQRRIRHQRILFFAKRHSNNVLSTNKKLNNILVLCYGNIYRSPLVEYLLKRVMAGERLEIKSAGFYDKEDRSCVDEYLELLSLRGYDLAAHRSRKVKHDDVEWADLIIIMDRKNWDLMHQMNRSAITKLIWVGAFTHNMPVEVMDPYGMGVDATNKVVTQLEMCVTDIAEQIKLKRASYSMELGSDA